jgi:hypothetical protein
MRSERPENGNLTPRIPRNLLTTDLDKNPGLKRKKTEKDKIKSDIESSNASVGS